MERYLLPWSCRYKPREKKQCKTYHGRKKKAFDMESKPSGRGGRALRGHWTLSSRSAQAIATQPQPRGRCLLTLLLLATTVATAVATRRPRDTGPGDGADDVGWIGVSCCLTCWTFETMRVEEVGASVGDSVTCVDLHSASSAVGRGEEDGLCCRHDATYSLMALTMLAGLGGCLAFSFSETARAECKSRPDCLCRRG